MTAIDQAREDRYLYDAVAMVLARDPFPPSPIPLTDPELMAARLIEMFRDSRINTVAILHRQIEDLDRCVNAALALHRDVDGDCEPCGTLWPCPTARALSPVTEHINRCAAHGRADCQQCHLTRPGGLDEQGRCSHCESYADTGMHWDTCPNRAFEVYYGNDRSGYVRALPADVG